MGGDSSVARTVLICAVARARDRLSAVDDQYFTDSSPARGDETRLLEVSARGFTLSMRVSSRVFSASKLDTGTRQLLEVAPDLPPRGALLDLGCGWGPLATVMSLEAPRCEVWAVDVNSRAVDLTARNAAANGASGVRALKACEALAESVRSATFFDVIWSNPPVRIGKEAMHEMLSQWLGRLAPEGVAYLVVQRHLGADSLIAWLNDQGLAARKYASKKGYRIIEVRRG
mgnify:FL=1